MVHLGRQVGDLDRRAAGAGLPVAVVEAHQRILVGDVELVADQRQPVGRVEVIGEHRAFLVASVAVLVAQQGQAIAALNVGDAFRLDDAGDEILRGERRVGSAASFGDQDIAVRQHQGLARDFQVGCDRSHGIALRGVRPSVAPRRRIGDLHDRAAARGAAAAVLDRLRIARVRAPAQKHRGRSKSRAVELPSPSSCQRLPAAVVEKLSAVAATASTATTAEIIRASGMLAQASLA